ncbi:MAG: FCD domain-containing protein, partial [Anaerolineae bacterium]|nr:FCD domain-containing protein [Anaerolineae bacterium]
LSLRLWYYALAQVGDMRSAILEHAAILEALKAHDADQAERLSKMHVKSFQDEIQAIMFKLV